MSRVGRHSTHSRRASSELDSSTADLTITGHPSHTHTRPAPESDPPRILLLLLLLHSMNPLRDTFSVDFLYSEKKNPSFRNTSYEGQTRPWLNHT